MKPTAPIRYKFSQFIVEGMRTHFQGEKFSYALMDVIHEIGDALIVHFPKGPSHDSKNH